MAERILIVEDDAIAQLTLAQYLQDLGFPHSVAVNNGKDAIREIKSGTVVLVFLDIRIMGEWDGITTAQHIKEHHPTLPLVFLTANTDPKTLKRAQQTDPLSIIRKPYDRETLLKAVNEALGYGAPTAKSTLSSPSAPPDSPAVGVSVTNAKGILVSVNSEFCRLHRCSEAEAVGRPFTDFFPENIRKFVAALHRDLIAGISSEGGGVWTVVDPRGAPRQVTMTVDRLSLNDELYKISTFVDTAQQQEHAEKLKKILKEKDAFAREIHHRVKNNLNVISGLFYLQAEKIKDRPDVYHLFQESISRIKTMSVVHEQLYDYDNYATINLNSYVQLLASSIQATFKNIHYVSLTTRVEPIELDVDRAVACGLIINEVMTNSFKYAFVEQHADSEVLIEGRRCQGTITLTIQDNGVGLPTGFDMKQAKTLGIQLIKTLTGQLGGSVTMCPNSPRGSRVELTFEA